MALNVYTVIRADGPVRVRRDVRDFCQPDIGDDVQYQGELKGRVIQVNPVGEDTFDLFLDRNSKITVANLLAIGVP